MTRMTTTKVVLLLCVPLIVNGMLADRSRLVRNRQAMGKAKKLRDNGSSIEEQSYRSGRVDGASSSPEPYAAASKASHESSSFSAITDAVTDARLVGKQKIEPWKKWAENRGHNDNIGIVGNDTATILESQRSLEESRRLSQHLSGCCHNYQRYSASDLCALYGQDCDSGQTSSYDSVDEGKCSENGPSFIGISFAVNTAHGNPYSFQLCDQFPMANLIDRDYEFVMSMDEDGWLIGGGYSMFDDSGKMPYIDSAHVKLLRIGNINPNNKSAFVNDLYPAIANVSFPPFKVFPEYVEASVSYQSTSDQVPSADLTMSISIVELYNDNDSYSAYETFLDSLYSALYSIGVKPCMEKYGSTMKVPIARGVKFWSAYHMQQYLHMANLEVAVWQAMYPHGVIVGSSSYAAFPPGRGRKKQEVGYGNLYFFYDQANITKAFQPYRQLTNRESYYATMYKAKDTSAYYASTTSSGYDYDDDKLSDWEYNPFSWNQKSAKHDMTKGWDLPPNCLQEGEAFFGIALSRKSGSTLTRTHSFQDQFDFQYLVDQNGTYIKGFGTNHGWLTSERIGNAVGYDTLNIPIFYVGSTNPDMGGISLTDLIKVAKNVDFGTLYIKPAFVFIDSDGHLKLQFEVDTTSAMAYLYDNLCVELGITWNYYSPKNDLGVYSNCAMHAASDRARYGCGPDGTGTGGFCPQATLAYSPRFISENLAAAYLSQANAYVDYWRSLYPSGVAVGSGRFFCRSGGCLSLFLNRFDVFQVFEPNLDATSLGEWPDATFPPSYSPAPTWIGGCDDPRNSYLDSCVHQRHKPKPITAASGTLGSVGRVSLMFVIFMSVTLSLSIFFERAHTKMRPGESYMSFFTRDLVRQRRKRRIGRLDQGLEAGMLPESSIGQSKSNDGRSTRSNTGNGGSVRSGKSGSSNSPRKLASNSPLSGKSANSSPRGDNSASNSPRGGMPGSGNAFGRSRSLSAMAAQQKHERLSPQRRVRSRDSGHLHGFRLDNKHVVEVDEDDDDGSMQSGKSVDDGCSTQSGKSGSSKTPSSEAGSTSTSSGPRSEAGSSTSNGSESVVSSRSQRSSSTSTNSVAQGGKSGSGYAYSRARSLSAVAVQPERLSPQRRVRSGLHVRGFRSDQDNRLFDLTEENPQPKDKEERRRRLV